MILVTGALGFVGRHVVANLLAEGESVRVLLPERWQRRLPWEGAEVFTGSIFEEETLFHALSGVHTLIHLASAQWWGRLNDLEYVDLEGTRNVLEAARSARIGRIIYLSHIGAEPAAGFHLLRVKGQAEELIRQSGLAYTIFRSGVVFGEDDQFVNNIARLLRSNPFFIFQPSEGENLLNPIYVEDLALAIVKALEVMELVDETVEIGGADYVSFNEMLRTVMRVSHCRRTIVSMPPYTLRAWANLWRISPLRFPVTPQWYDLLAGNRTADLRNLYNYTGVHPRRFEDTLLTYMPRRRYFLEYLRYLFTRRKRSPF